MNKALAFLLVGCLLAEGICGQGSFTGGDTASAAGTATSPRSPGSITPDTARIRNPLVAGGLSLVLPGAGQVYDRHYIRGALYAGIEVGLAFYARFWYDRSKQHNASITRLQSALDTLTDEVVYDFKQDTITTYLYDATLVRMQLDTSRFEQRTERIRAYHAICWASGCYLYSIADAVDKTGALKTSAPKKPGVAAALSAIPGLGLGQLYNGRPSKAGLIWMTQAGLGFMAYNYHTRMREAEATLAVMENRNSRQFVVNSKILTTGSEGRWVDRWRKYRRDAFRNRNTFLWYSLFFYLYGVADAAVDAHLHDFDERIRLEPDLAPHGGAMGLTLSYTF